MTNSDIVPLINTSVLTRWIKNIYRPMAMSSVVACSWTGLFEDVSSKKAVLFFTDLLIEGYVQQSNDGDTRNNNEKSSTTNKYKIQAY